jgi:hypothetical protein
VRGGPAMILTDVMSLCPRVENTGGAHCSAG